MTCNPHYAAFAERYALARYLPDMQRGFTIATRYGAFGIDADDVTRHPELLRAVEAVLCRRLERAERVGGAA